MKLFLLSLTLQLALQSLSLLPPRSAMENPISVSPIPQKLRKDYDKIWNRFLSGKEDAKLTKDLEKLLQKQKMDQLWTIQGYLALYHADDDAARQKFTQALTLNPKNRIAMSYLAEFAFDKGEYARAATLYSELRAIGASQPELETKRQKAFLLATDNLLRAAVRAEGEGKFAEAEDYYRQALRVAPNDPLLQTRLADLLIRANKKEDADAARKAAEAVSPRTDKVESAEAAKRDDLEDLGRWGSEIGVFEQIRDAEALTREQVALLIVRYFPQVTELRQTLHIVTDIQDSNAKVEIQNVLNVGLMDAYPTHDFRPDAPITRGDFARALARLSRLIGMPASAASSVGAPDVASTNTLYPDLQLVLGSGLLTLQDSGSFEVAGRVTGRQAVRSVDQLLRSFQQAQR
jgi:Tfp pilus assembly protein PilF